MKNNQLRPYGIVVFTLLFVAPSYAILDKVRVSFLGDSITASMSCNYVSGSGAKFVDKGSKSSGKNVASPEGYYYTYLAQSLPNTKYALKNCGNNGRTMQSGGSSYWTTGLFDPLNPNANKAILMHCSTPATGCTADLPPNIIVINLGTNDAKSYNGNVANFQADYISKMSMLADWFPNARIIAQTPEGTFKNSEGTYGYSKKPDGSYAYYIRSDLYLDPLPDANGYQAAIANAVTDVTTSKVNTYYFFDNLWQNLRSSSVNYGNSDTCDGIHPNRNGYAKIAPLTAQKVREVAFEAGFVTSAALADESSVGTAGTATLSGVTISVGICIVGIIAAVIAAVFINKKRKHKSTPIAASDLGLDI